MSTELWLPVILVSTATVFGVVSLVLLWELFRAWLRQQRARRQLRAVTRPSDAPSPKRVASLVRDDLAPTGLASRIARALPGVETARRLIRQARVDIGVESFMAVSFAISAALGATLMILTGSLLYTAVAAGVGVLLPYWWLARRRAQHEAAFEEQFPEAIELLTRAIRAGHPISSGMRMVGEDAPEPVAEEFRLTFEEQRFGLPFEDALANLVHRNDQVDVRIFATALLIQREVGGNLAEILDNLADTIRARFHIRRQLRVYTAQGRMTGWVLGLLPIVVGGIIWLIEPEYMNVLLQNGGGRVILGTAVLLQLIGVLWIRRVIAIEI